jgi:hypothetical protein
VINRELRALKHLFLLDPDVVAVQAYNDVDDLQALASALSGS